MALPLVLGEGPCHGNFPGCLTVCNLLPTGPAWRLHLCLLRGRATPISPDVLLPSLGCTPRQLYRFGCGSGPPVEAELCGGDAGVYGSLFPLACRSGETSDPLEEGVQIHLLVHLMKSRTRDLVCARAHPVGPGLGGRVFKEA